MSIAHINIGSNLGHRVMAIDRAVSCLAERVGTVMARSAMVESSAWGYDSSNRYINVGVNVDTSLSALSIVRELKSIESVLAPGESHRDDAGNYADRTVDLDLICLDNQVSYMPEATVPHPRMHLREFVLRPMAELMPQWCHPILHMTVSEILDGMCNNSMKEYVKKTEIE